MAPTAWTPVRSSIVAAVRHDDERGHLDVRQGLLSAPSVGTCCNTRVKEHRLEPRPGLSS